MNPICVDLSHHNPTPDWDALRAGGTLGVIHKATEGTSYVDDQLFMRAAPAIRAGLAWSTYHFMRPGGIENQMDHYLNTVDPVPGERVVLDHEDGNVSLFDLEDAVGYVMARRPDLQITIYSGHLIKEQVGSQYIEFLAEATSLWIAQYTSAPSPSWPEMTWPLWSLWQYTDQAEVQGVSAKVDGNRFNGSTSAFLAWMGPRDQPMPELPPEPVLVAKKVIVNIQADPGVDVIVHVNGEECDT